MKNTVITALIFFITLSQSNAQKINGFQKEDPQAAGFSIERLERLDQWMSSEIEQNGMAGATVIISRKGKLAYAKSFGKSNLETQRKMTTNDLFKVASMSKVITSVAVLQMYEQGYFLLDDPISKYIPVLDKIEILSSFNKKDSTFQTIPSIRPITISHILTHNSGVNRCRIVIWRLSCMV
jgi:CubicO group peptidase (beta-lactamase class C family)